MAIDNLDTIDGMAIDKERQALVLLLTDHLPFEGAGALSEKDHLLLLQDKINAYISFIEAEQFRETYPNEEFNIAVIEIHFKYEITKTCENFLNAVQAQISEIGILIEASIG